MRKIVVVLVSTALAMLLLSGVAWADTLTVTNTARCDIGAFERKAPSAPE